MFNICVVSYVTLFVFLYNPALRKALPNFVMDIYNDNKGYLI